MSELLVDSEDLSDAEQVIGAHYSKIRLSACGAPTRARIVRSTIGSLTVDDIHFASELDYDMAPLEKLALCRVRSGRIEQRRPDGSTASAGPGSVIVSGVDAGVGISGRVIRARFDCLSVDRELLSSLAADAGSGEGTVPPIGATPICDAANSQLVSAIDYVVHGVARSGAANHPLLADTAQRHLAAVMLATLPTEAAGEPSIGDRDDSTPVLLRRAMAFIEENAQQRISVGEIAEDVRVTARALQYMFRRHHDCTPMDYVRRVRLHRAHLDLIGNDPMTTTVGEIANRWGFTHLGRFAVLYRTTYGQSPHVTLRS
jgi:AraC-like DNA-binding protein